MGKFALTAIGAQGNTGGGKEIVGAALGGALFTMAPFRIRHGEPFKLRCAALECKESRTAEQILGAA